MKKILCLLILVIILIISCSRFLMVGNKSKESTIKIYKKDTNQNCIISLGMHKMEVGSQLNSLKIETINGQSCISTNGAEYRNTMICPSGYYFEFNKEDLLNIIMVDGNTPTASGLKVGDSIKTMEKIYGVKYTKANDSSDSSSIMYEYKLSDCYLIITIKDEKVTSWTVESR